MDNKILQELISKNLEEIKLLVENLRNSEKPDPLLVEITSLKAKTLSQELMLLMPEKPVSNSENEEEPNVIFEAEEIIPDETVSEKEFAFVNNEEQETETESGVINHEEVLIEEPAEQPGISENEVIEETIREESPVDEESSLNLEKAEEKEEQEVIPAPVEIENQEEIREEPVSEEQAQEQIPVEEIVEPATQPVEIVQEVTPEAAPEVVQEKAEEKTDIQEKKILGEQFVKEPSLNDRLAATAHHESKIKGKPVTKIKSAIGLNDRFLYTRELFGNESSKFETTVDHLDQLNNLHEAVDYLSKNFQWTKNEASLKFMELVKRRFEN